MVGGSVMSHCAFELRDGRKDILRMKYHNNRGGWPWLIVLLFLLHQLKIEIQLLLFLPGPSFHNRKKKKKTAICVVPNKIKCHKSGLLLFSALQPFPQSWHRLLTPLKVNDGSHAFHSPFFRFFNVVLDASQRGFLYSLCSHGIPCLSSSQASPSQA